MAGEESYRYMVQRATLPWTNAGHTGGASRFDKASLHHKGWTLVDMADGWRWAVNDNNCNRRKRICKINASNHTYAEEMSRFRAYADEQED